jgi:HlyD family secretion protein
MDIPRPERKRQKRIRQMAIAAAGIVVLVVVTVGLTQLEPAAPSVARASLWIEAVKQGEMVRDVRGSGTLVPRALRWIGSQSDGRVERVIVRPGAVVEPDTVLVEMTNPDLMQQAEDARFAFEAGQAEFDEFKITLANQQLDQRASHAAARAEYEGARLQAESERMASDVVPENTIRRSEFRAEQLKIRMEIEEERIKQFAASIDAQLDVRQTRLMQLKNVYDRRLQLIEDLKVRAGVAGTVQEVMVEEGQRVPLGGNIARVADPADLQAELKVAETQVSDVVVGQLVRVDTRRGIVEGKVSRIDPAAVSGTVQVDVELTGALPRGVRPDMSVDGTIEIERLPQDTVFAGRSSYSQPNTTIGLYKLVDDGNYAVRVPVKIGSTAVNAMQILQGLVPGDEVILSDTSAWEDEDRIRIDY